MHIILFRYSARVVMLNHLFKTNSIVIVPKSQEQKYITFEAEGNPLPNVIFIEDYTLPNIILEIRKIEKSRMIESITTLSEEDMDWVGLLHDHFVKGNSRFASNSMFKDKYLMRSLLIDKVKQPYFRLLESQDDYEKFWLQITGNTAIVKPRYGAGSEEVFKINRGDKISVKYFSGKYLIEDFISLSRMMTCDGYAFGAKVCRFFSHEYEELLLDSLNTTKEIVVRTNKLYSTKISLIEKVYEECIKVLSEFSVEGELTPFHFEWFYSEQTEELLFCEVGKRFGGAEIPKLIKYSFNIDILKEYWEALIEGDKGRYVDGAKSLSIPVKISTTYSPYRKEGTLVSVPKQEEFDWTENTYIFVKPGEKTENAQSIVENNFMSQFTSKDESDYQENLKKIRALTNKFLYER